MPTKPWNPRRTGSAGRGRSLRRRGKMTRDDTNPPKISTPASLPPIDSITALSDIRDFLRAGCAGGI